MPIRRYSEGKGRKHGRHGWSSSVWINSTAAESCDNLKCKRLSRIANLSPFKKMLVLAIMAGRSSWPVWLFICCPGSPNAVVVTRGHWHFQCSSDTICFLYFLAQRKRLRKQFNREREHTHIYIANAGSGMFAIQTASVGWAALTQEVHLWIQQSPMMLLVCWFCDRAAVGWRIISVQQIQWRTHFNKYDKQ